MKVFISHTKQDLFALKVAKALTVFLEERMIDVNFDEFSFDKGKLLSKQIESLILSSDKFIFIASPKAKKSKWVLKELEIAKSIVQEKTSSESFLIVFNISGNRFSNLLTQLDDSLIINANNKNYFDKFYDVFFSLVKIKDEDFIRADQRTINEAEWSIYERTDVINVTKDFDADIESQYVLHNYSEKRKRYTHRINYWAENTEALENISVSAIDRKGNKLEVLKEVEEFRGKITNRYTIKSNKHVYPNSNFYFTIYTVFKKAYYGQETGQYVLDFEQKKYGRYKCFISLPRNFIKNKFSVECDSGSGYTKEKIGKVIGHNSFTFEVISPNLGTRYKVKFSPLRFE